MFIVKGDDDLWGKSFLCLIKAYYNDFHFYFNTTKCFLSILIALNR